MKVLLEILQYSQENTCARSQACNFIKKRLWHRCFPVNFAKFLRIFFTERFRTTPSGCRHLGLQL